jgi:multidrug efflux pump subunit AcrA (membrane-fusion protein)
VKYIHLGDPVQVRITSLDKTLTGTVKRFAEDVSADTRTMHTEVEVLNPSHNLMPGLYAEATLTLERKDDALVLPLQAVDQSGGLAKVDLVDANSVLQVRNVTTGIETAAAVEILSGLKQGDQVVVSDRSGLKAGMRVKPKPMDVQPYQENSQ